MRQHLREVEHWAKVEEGARGGERLFWLNHPRVAQLFHAKGLIEGCDWRDWVCRQLGRVPREVLELGCGDGAALYAMASRGHAESIVGLDLEQSRFSATAAKCQAEGIKVSFLACDVNEVRLPEKHFDLIYALHSVHHFERLEHVFEECNRALTDDGYVVFEEYVGPSRFQWTDEQLALTQQLLGLLPEHLRMYRQGILKQAEGRSTEEQVIAVCPSEAIRSQYIVPEFQRCFQMVWHKPLGGTIQHLLYSGIIQNFSDQDGYTLHAIDCIDSLEQVFIDYGIIQSDFSLLVGRKKPVADAAAQDPQQGTPQQGDEGVKASLAPLHSGIPRLGGCGGKSPTGCKRSNWVSRALRSPRLLKRQETQQEPYPD